MEFGRLPEEELNAIDFKLRPDPVFNKAVLGGSRASKPGVYVGCAKWGIPEWGGKIYPANTRERYYLDHYIKLFNSIELNATHYKIIGPAGIGKWAAKASGRDFLFCPKMYQAITHRGKLKEKAFLTNEFLRGVSAFGKHLGPVFIQLSEGFSPKRKSELFDYLAGLPRDFTFFIELRHPAWFAKEATMNEWLTLLRDLQMGAIITDSSARRDCVHMGLPIAKAFIRFVGNSLHPTDYSRVDEWVERIKTWLDEGLEQLYFFMHMHDEIHSPELSIYLIDQINQACGLKIPKPVLLNQ